MEKAVRILLVDSMGMLYRGHFAMIGNPLRAPGGMVTSGLHHLVNETLSLIERLRPDSAAAHAYRAVARVLLAELDQRPKLRGGILAQLLG